jgi:hypothetical protein
LAITDWLRGFLTPSNSSAPESVPYPSPDVVVLVRQFLAAHTGKQLDFRKREVESLKSQVTGMSREQQVEAVLLLMDTQSLLDASLSNRRVFSSADVEYNQHLGVQQLLAELMKRQLPWSSGQAEGLFSKLSNCRRGQFHSVPLKRSVGLAEQISRDGELTDNMRASLGKLARQICPTAIGTYVDPEHRRVAARIDKLLTPHSSDDGTKISLAAVDAWTKTMVDRLNTLDESQQLAWTELLAHCESATSSAPTKAFLKKAGERAQAIGGGQFADVMIDVLESLGTAYHEDIAPFRAPDHPYDPTLIEPSRADLLRGLIWTTSVVDDKALLTALAGAADRCFQKIRNVGPRAPKIGNACLWVFAHNESLEAVAQLNRLLGRVKHASVRKQIERSLNAAAEHHGLSRSDLEDMAVPTCGFTSVGELRQQVGDYTAVLTVQSTSKTKVEWLAPSGKIQKSVPKVVKDEFASELKTLKASEKLAQQTLAGQRDRLESFYLSNKKWTYPAWREHVADHPLMGWFAERLIWTFNTGESCVHTMWRNHAPVDVNGKIIDPPDGDALVSLWHPIVDTPEAIRAWRNRVMENEVTQPFKQAYRELYILTDAERNTGTYSNRFASHVVKQHQFRALCQARGWQYDLMGQWDSHNTPEKILPAYNLRAEFWVEQAANETASEVGIFLYLATDQVRFYECDAEAYARDRWNARRNTDPIPLDQIPPLVLSEILRDVDLFVGVASVGNDPNWNDGGPEGRYRNYWNEVSFGDLTATAQTRREILQRLVPRLKIADRCSFDDKFLVVRGERRTYKIHLGSSNILMEPNDQYLCIVPGRGDGGGEKVFLPFEGDQRLAVILSKAMMLADDTKITDPTILSQIGR